jgi:hypothetical protein
MKDKWGYYEETLWSKNKKIQKIAIKYGSNKN